MADATSFLNSKRRVIYMSQTRSFFVKTAAGKKSYNPKAKFYKNPAGSTVATKYVKNLTNIPALIRPKFNRATRKNAGVARGKYAARVVGVRVHHVKRRGYIGEMFNDYKTKATSSGPGPVHRRFMLTKLHKARRAAKRAAL